MNSLLAIALVLLADGFIGALALLYEQLCWRQDSTEAALLGARKPLMQNSYWFVTKKHVSQMSMRLSAHSRFRFALSPATRISFSVLLQRRVTIERFLPVKDQARRAVRMLSPHLPSPHSIGPTPPVSACTDCMCSALWHRKRRS